MGDGGAEGAADGTAGGLYVAGALLETPIGSGYEALRGAEDPGTQAMGVGGPLQSGLIAKLPQGEPAKDGDMAMVGLHMGEAGSMGAAYMLPPFTARS